MFYSQFILAKKGPLGTIWIAAHLERKLRKNQVTETNIGVSVDSILCPEVPIALRLSGHLLLGVVRIYSRKVNYLFHDCSEALVKIKQAFHTGAVDLPPEATTAPFHSITLPETFDLDELELLPDREALFLANSSIDHHVTSREQITLQENIEDSTYLGSQFGLDERFTDGGTARLDFDEDLFTGKPKDQEKGVGVEEDGMAEPMDEDDRPEENNVTGEERQEDTMEVDDQPKVAGDAANTFDINVVPVDEEASAAAAEEETIQVAGADTENQADTEAGGEEQGAAPEAAAASEAKDPAIESKEAREDEDLPPAAAAAEGVQVPASPLEKNDDEQQEHDAAGRDKETLEAQDAVLHDKEQQQHQEVEAPPLPPPPPLQQQQQEQFDDVPEIEKVRSAAEVPLLEPSVLEELREPDSTPAPPSQKRDGVIEPAALVEDAIKLQEAEDTPSISAAMREFAPPGGDDLLASILGRRTPSLVVAPTPPAKRHKPGPKPGPRKRKVHFDDSMVLDGDHIRQQLSDTSSIRRVRKRAPCTEYELWGSEKEALGQQMFDEPLILAPCGSSIRDVYRSVYVAGDAKQSESDATEASARHDKYQLEEEDHREPITLEDDPLDDSEFEARYRLEEDLEQLEIFPRPESNAAAARTPEAAAQETIKENSEGREVSGQEEEAQPGVSPEKQACPPADEKEPETAAGADDPEQTKEQPLPADDADAEANDPTGDQIELARSDEKLDDAAEQLPAVCEPEATEENREAAAGSDAAGGAAEAVAETRDHGSVEDLPASAQPQDESSKANTAEEEMAAAEDNTETAEASNAVDTDQHPAADNNNNAAEALDFLVDSKDEDAAHGDDADNYDADYPQEQAQDNSGWSVRTRAVCQYLRVTFESMESARKEGGVRGAPRLGLERLLHGKTRRESARMFFESLVLKTKDYISVEQKAPFDSIYISARPKLMKADM